MAKNGGLCCRKWGPFYPKIGLFGRKWGPFPLSASPIEIPGSAPVLCLCTSEASGALLANVRDIVMYTGGTQNLDMHSFCKLHSSNGTFKSRFFVLVQETIEFQRAVFFGIFGPCPPLCTRGGQSQNLKFFVEHPLEWGLKRRGIARKIHL